MKWRRIKLALAMIALFVLAIYGVVHFQRTGSRKTLERYKAELRARGEKLFFSEYLPPPSTDPDEVASRQIFASNILADIDEYPLLFEYLSPGKARVAWRGDLHLESSDEQVKLARGDWRRLSAQENAQSETLARFAAAAVHPTPDSGWSYLERAGDFPIEPMIKKTLPAHVAGHFAYAALLNLHEGRLLEAVTNLHLIASLSAIYREEPDVLCQVVRAAIAQIGLRATWQALQSTNWNPADLSSLQSSWENTNFFDGIERAFVGERTKCLLMAQFFRSPKSNGELKLFLEARSGAGQKLAQVFGYLKSSAAFAIFRARELDDEELQSLKYWSAIIECIRLMKSGHALSEVQQLARSAKASSDQFATGKSDLLAEFHSIVVTDESRTLTNVARAETQLRLTVTAIALKRYQLKHNAPPPTLSALVPEFISSVPIDPMSGKELRYRLNPDATFVLYSVGEDGVDDGGDPNPRTPGDKPDLWTGKDAVWPTAATEEEQTAADAKAAPQSSSK